MKHRSIYRSDISEAGFTLIDCFVAFFILLAATISLGRMSEIFKMGSQSVDIEAVKIQILENMNATVLNQVAWRYTYLRPENSEIKTHLSVVASGPPSSTIDPPLDPPPHSMVLVNTKNEIVIDKLGTMFNIQGKKAVGLDGIFKVTAKWWKGLNKTAVILIRVHYVNDKETDGSARPKDTLNDAAVVRHDAVTKVYKPALLNTASCIDVTAVIKAKKAGTHGNYNTAADSLTMNGPFGADPYNHKFIWDYATVSCPREYYLAFVYTRPGWHAHRERAFASPIDPRTGSCHQISAQTPEQIGLGATESINGTCVARCCVFE